MLASVEEIAGAWPSPRPCGSGSNAHPRSISTRRASPYLTQSHTAFRFRLSLRDIEELLFERGVTVTYETILNSTRALLAGRKRYGAGQAVHGISTRCL
jgi:hypothetical protein